MDISKSLYIALISRRKTQTWLAAQLGVSKQMVNKWCKSGRIRTDYLQNVAALLDYKVSELIALGEDSDPKAVGRAAIAECKTIINEG